jgi:hypothetical protein
MRSPRVLALLSAAAHGGIGGDGAAQLDVASLRLDASLAHCMHRQQRMPLAGIPSLQEALEARPDHASGGDQREGDTDAADGNFRNSRNFRYPSRGPARLSS